MNLIWILFWKPNISNVRTLVLIEREKSFLSFPMKQLKWKYLRWYFNTWKVVLPCICHNYILFLFSDWLEQIIILSAMKKVRQRKVRNSVEKNINILGLRQATFIYCLLLWEYLIWFTFGNDSNCLKKELNTLELN